MAASTVVAPPRRTLSRLISRLLIAILMIVGGGLTSVAVGSSPAHAAYVEYQWPYGDDILDLEAHYPQHIFGKVYDGSMHKGDDFGYGNFNNTKLPAVATGILRSKIAAGDGDTAWLIFGNRVTLEIADGKATMYGHMASLPSTAKGTTINRNASVGTPGSSGLSCSCAHMHLTMADSIDAAKYPNFGTQSGPHEDGQYKSSLLTNPGQWIRSHLGSTPPPPDGYGPVQFSTFSSWPNATLYQYTSGPTDLGLYTYPGTSPSFARLSNGQFITAFQTSGQTLWYRIEGTNYPTGWTMAPGTSPSVAAAASGGWRISFYSSSGKLFILTSSGGITDTNLPISGKGPSTVALANNKYVDTFQSPAGVLHKREGGVTVNLDNLLVAPNTSPTIASVPNGSWRIAFQAAGSQQLHIYTWGTGVTNLGKVMAAGTSPGITGLANNSFVEMYKTPSNQLYRYQAQQAHNTGEIMYGGAASPAVGASGTSFLVVFQGPNGQFKYRPYAPGGDSAYTVDTGLGVYSETTPAISTGW